MEKEKLAKLKEERLENLRKSDEEFVEKKRKDQESLRNSIKRRDFEKLEMKAY